MVGFMQSMFAQQMMKNHMVKSTAVSDAGLTKQTLYEVERSQFTAATYDRAREAVDAVNAEVAELLQMAWGRRNG
jgi:chromosome partitioning protein